MLHTYIYVDVDVGRGRGTVGSSSSSSRGGWWIGWGYVRTNVPISYIDILYIDIVDSGVYFYYIHAFMC